MEADDPLVQHATNSAKHLRRHRLVQLREHQDQLAETARHILIGTINLTMPEAASVTLKAEATREHWGGTWLAVSDVVDDQGREIAWRQLLSADDLALIVELQKDLTDCLAIPQDKVEVTFGC